MDSKDSGSAQGRVRWGGLLRLGRFSEWWEYKFIPAILIGYLTALQAGATPWEIIAGLGILLLALLPGGAFVSLINDLTDRQDDAAAQKPNRQEGVNRAIIFALIALCLAAGGAIAWLLRDDPVAVAVYALGWLAFSLYSLPPFRLKNRGLAGIICDAIGAHLVPAVLAALLCARILGVEASLPWLSAVTVWALCYGLRGIVSHQIGDLAADRSSGARTFVARHGQRFATLCIRWLVFPLEFAAMLAMAIQGGMAAVIAVVVALSAYGWLIYERIDRFDMTVTIVNPVPRSTLMLHEFYDVLLPVALLLAASFLQPATLLLLPVQFLLFPVRIRQLANDIIKLSDSRYERRSQRSG